MTCPLCLALYRYPVSLSCGHNACKSCVLAANLTGRPEGGGAGVRVQCPLCRELSSYSSESELRVNSSLAEAVAAMRGDAPRPAVCARCEGAAAELYCADCCTPLCPTCCEIIHTGRLREHAIGPISGAGAAAAALAPRCDRDGHQGCRKELYCGDCSEAVCVLCAQRHRRHQVLPLPDAGELEAARLRETLAAAERRRRELREACAALDAAAAAVEAATAEELLVFERTVDGLRQRLEARRDELRREARAGAVQELDRLRTARGAMVKLVAGLNEVGAQAERTLREGAGAVAAAAVRAELEKGLSEPLPRADPDCAVPQFSIGSYNELLSGIGSMALAFRRERVAGPSPARSRCSSAVLDSSAAAAAPPPAAADSWAEVPIPGSGAWGQLRLAEGAAGAGQLQAVPLQAAPLVLAAGTGQLRWERSTYGDTQIHHGGAVCCAAPAASWETVMSCQRLSAGTHHWEVRLDGSVAKDNAARRAVLVGVVLQGSSALCEVLGEDAFSVGFDCATGSLRSAGAPAVPYGTPCGVGDCVGVDLDVTAGTLCFLRNGLSMGIASRGLRSAGCYAAVSIAGGEQVTLLPAGTAGGLRRL
eukprot:TRINITY_DN12083_c0_g1_i1.p1 TRINITY_DN12083_c0_g1~~TRINITY_DN12083_c0_g1_i1.p1  ORF type:complete len:593 (+),score=146.68 TRINITY_DN12083_c0_g1_i1:98-1876(+)